MILELVVLKEGNGLKTVLPLIHNYLVFYLKSLLCY